ncbi:alpha/beta hydrolase [Piscinibacter gummiphilus]|uniref:Alpha/beta fold hydrolase n=1 Tax=Piscinibacter gummiphilus TaxID=946333 RepID=A0ABZ0CY50_9BURK|nr:alpha/beta fold hydrolase [Piscinibacter gummiphilus]WOB09922.1 alpha/beta fold hydrolase [Piscinibacter gummiphilus]
MNTTTLLHGSMAAAAAEGLRWWKRVHRESVPAPALLGALQCREVDFPSRDGRARIAATLLHGGADACAAVVLVVGQVGSWGSDARVEGRSLHVRTLAQALRSRGITVLVTRLRGHGESERHDVLGAVDYLLAQGHEPGNIGVIGASLGACAALMAAAEEPAIAAVVADSPRRDLRGEARCPAEVLMPLARWVGRLLSGVDLGRRPWLGDLASLRNRAVMVVHGRGDRQVPATMGQAVAEACAAQLWLTASGSHAGTLHEALPLYITRVVDFFCQHLPVQPREPLLVPAQPLEATA